MNKTRGPAQHPAEQLCRMATRTLWVLYTAFCVAVIVYAAIILVVLRSGLADGREAESVGPSTAVTTLQITFLVVGAICLYLVFRLGGALLRPGRLWHGEQSLEGLAARLAQRGAARGRPEGQQSTTGSGNQMAEAVQHVVGRAIVAHLIPWVLAEVPALLGLVDRFLSGPQGVWPVLLALSVLGLALRRPSGQRMREILEPIYRIPFQAAHANGAALPRQ